MKPEDVKNQKLEQELSEEELDGATGGTEEGGSRAYRPGGKDEFTSN
jgi:hypothetical protein